MNQLTPTLDVAKKEVYTQLCWQPKSPKLKEFTTDLQSESDRKNCFRIARQMAREGRDVICLCCMNNDVGNVVYDADGEVDSHEVMVPCCLILEEEVAADIK